MEADGSKQREFYDLVERFRNEDDPEVAKQLGDELGRIIFGDVTEVPKGL